MSVLNRFDQRQKERAHRLALVVREPRTLWLLVTASLFCLVDYVRLSDLIPYQGWRLIHLVSGACFFGVILISSIMEELIARAQHLRLISLYHQLVLTLDRRVITTSVSALLLSAIALMQSRGHRLWDALTWPTWAFTALVLMTLLGLTWALIDVPSQARLSQLLEEHEERLESPVSPALRAHLNRRRWINALAVSATLSIYTLMVFKPL